MPSHLAPSWYNDCVDYLQGEISFIAPKAHKQTNRKAGERSLLCVMVNDVRNPCLSLMKPLSKKKHGAPEMCQQ